VKKIEWRQTQRRKEWMIDQKIRCKDLRDWMSRDQGLNRHAEKPILYSFSGIATALGTGMDGTDIL
jgi:hypothetical protein